MPEEKACLRGQNVHKIVTQSSMVVPVNRVWREVKVGLPDGEKSEQWIRLFQDHFVSKVCAVPLADAAERSGHY